MSPKKYIFSAEFISSTAL